MDQYRLISFQSRVSQKDPPSAIYEQSTCDCYAITGCKSSILPCNLKNVKNHPILETQRPKCKIISLAIYKTYTPTLQIIIYLKLSVRTKGNKFLRNEPKNAKLKIERLIQNCHTRIFQRIFMSMNF